MTDRFILIFLLMTIGILLVCQANMMERPAKDVRLVSQHFSCASAS